MEQVDGFILSLWKYILENILSLTVFFIIVAHIHQPLACQDNLNSFKNTFCYKWNFIKFIVNFKLGSLKSEADHCCDTLSVSQGLRC